jgi:hypothetical protein
MFDMITRYFFSQPTHKPRRSPTLNVLPLVDQQHEPSLSLTQLAESMESSIDKATLAMIASHSQDNRQESTF